MSVLTLIRLTFASKHDVRILDNMPCAATAFRADHMDRVNDFDIVVCHGIIYKSLRSYVITEVVWMRKNCLLLLLLLWLLSFI